MAVMVKVLVPVVVRLLVLTVRVEMPPFGTETGFGLKLAVEREGNPETLSETEPVKPPEGAIVTL